MQNFHEKKTSKKLPRVTPGPQDPYTILYLWKSLRNRIPCTTSGYSFLSEELNILNPGGNLTDLTVARPFLFGYLSSPQCQPYKSCHSCDAPRLNIRKGSKPAWWLPAPVFGLCICLLLLHFIGRYEPWRQRNSCSHHPLPRRTVNHL